MVETLALKTDAWEKERGIEFTYDGVSLTLTFLVINIPAWKTFKSHRHEFY